MEGFNFGDWLDRNKISVSKAAKMFGVSEKRIYSWRGTSGIPERKIDWVHNVVSNYSGVSFEQRTNRISIPSSDEEFDNWQRAALSAGKTVTEWAIEALNEVSAKCLTGDSNEKKESKVESDLHKDLKNWRLAKAKELGVPAFRIAANSILDEICEEKPTTKQDLLKIKGLGAKKMDDFGDEIVKILDKHRTADPNRLL